jgi:plastocyanin
VSRAAARIAAVAISGAAVVTAAPGASGQHSGHGGAGARVSILFASVAPSHLDVVAGDTVTWTNTSVRRHTVTADDGSFDSGSVSVGGTFERTFEAEGDVSYHCRLHPGINGDVAVHRLLLAAPAGAAAPGRPFPLAGRTALAEGTPVTIEEDAGEGFVAVARTEAGEQGAILATVTPRTTASYRAVAGGQASPPVLLVVVDRTVTATYRRVPGRKVVVRASVTPPAPRATVVLQLRLRERFGWWPVRTRRLGASSSVQFKVPLRKGVPARVALTLPDGATVLATSPAVRLPRR